MPPKNARKRAAEAGPSNAPDEPAERRPRAEAASAAPQGRREGMAELARRRAAHFATWQTGGDDDGGEEGANPHVGGNTARTLGPWSSAVQLVNAREKQLAQRQDKQLAAARGVVADGEGGGGGSRAAAWRPTRDVALGPRPRNTVQPLANVCLNLVATHVEDVESLWGLPDLVKARIAGEVCARRALTPSALHLFTDHRPAEVAIPDCSQLEADALGAALLQAATPNLEKLDLGMCGRGMTHAVAKSLAAAGVLTSLASLRLGAAYRLGDAGVQALLTATPALTSLCLPHCPRVEGPAIEALPRLVPHLRRLDLAGCRGLGSVSLLAAIKGLPQLEALCVDGIPEADDALLKVLAGAAPALQSLSLAVCPAVTDTGVEALGQGLPGLSSLTLDECKISPAGIAALAAHCTALQQLSLQRCTRVNDEAVAALAAMSTLRRVSLNGAVLVTGKGVEALAKGGAACLEEVDLSWCRDVPAAALGLLADSCVRLRRLVLWGCTQADEMFMYGHSNEALEVVGRGEELQPVQV